MASKHKGDSQELRIVLLGVCGARKSSVANAILGREAFKESRTRESEKQRGRVEDRNISIIDTPGFFNTQLTDEEMKNEMMKSMYLCYPGPHLFLLVINLETFEEDERNIVEQILENFGAQALKFTMVLFIGREKMSKRDLTAFIFTIKFQKLVRHCKSKYHVINSKNEMNQTHITELLEKIDEIIKQNNDQFYDNEIYLKYPTKSRKERNIQEKKKVRTNVQGMKQEKNYEEEVVKPSAKSLRNCFEHKGETNTAQKPEKYRRRKCDQKKQQTETEQHPTQTVSESIKYSNIKPGKCIDLRSATGNTILHYTNEMYMGAQRKICEEVKRKKEEEKRKKLEEEEKIRQDERMRILNMVKNVALLVTCFVGATVGGTALTGGGTLRAAVISVLGTVIVGAVVAGGAALVSAGPASILGAFVIVALVSVALAIGGVPLLPAALIQRVTAVLSRIQFTVSLRDTEKNT